MYLKYWGLKVKPFENTPNPRFLYPSKEHREGLRKLLYAITEGKGCAMLTGEYGCGKTHLIRTMVANLDPQNYEVALINYPLFNGEEFLEEVLHQFGEHCQGGKTMLEGFREVSRFFFERVASRKKNVLIIDEAQIIDDREVYEALRLLLNIQLEDRFLVNILLVGQPELRDQVLHYPQLDQRVAIKFHLERFDAEDTAAYVRHRLKVAGATRELFTPEALYLVFRMSEGVPRRTNTVCDLCLFEGASRKVSQIDEAIMKKVL